jgi:hypothetical protein
LIPPELKYGIDHIPSKFHSARGLASLGSHVFRNNLVPKNATLRGVITSEGTHVFHASNLNRNMLDVCVHAVEGAVPVPAKALDMKISSAGCEIALIIVFPLAITAGTGELVCSQCLPSGDAARQITTPSSTRTQ